jgi:hypothetical protein
MDWRPLLKTPWLALTAFCAGGILLVAMILLIPKEQLTDPAVKLLGNLLWAYTAGFIIIQFRPQVGSLLGALTRRLQQGGAVKLPGVSNFRRSKFRLNGFLAPTARKR